MARTLHFKSKGGYGKWLAYGHIHKVFKGHPPYKRIVIKGRAHKVKHSK